MPDEIFPYALGAVHFHTSGIGKCKQMQLEFLRLIYLKPFLFSEKIFHKFNWSQNGSATLSALILGSQEVKKGAVKKIAIGMGVIMFVGTFRICL